MVMGAKKASSNIFDRVAYTLQILRPKIIQLYVNLL